jgi:hypothetical protein
MGKDFYKVLGVPKSATEDEIKKGEFSSMKCSTAAKSECV